MAVGWAPHPAHSAAQPVMPMAMIDDCAGGAVRLALPLRRIRRRTDAAACVRVDAVHATLRWQAASAIAPPSCSNYAVMPSEQQ
eukprot:303299-Chlamydomonas_euryale.AAC.1